MARNPGGVKVVGIALTLEDALELPTTIKATGPDNKGNEQEVLTTTKHFAEYFRHTLSRAKGPEVEIYTPKGELIYSRDKQGQTYENVTALANWYKGCELQVPYMRGGRALVTAKQAAATR